MPLLIPLLKHCSCHYSCPYSCHVAGAEDQVSVNQQVERSKMESDYQAQMATLSDELNRVRQELTSRTEVMGQEMERWRQAAEATARQDTHSLTQTLSPCTHPTPSLSHPSFVTCSLTYSPNWLKSPFVHSLPYALTYALKPLTHNPHSLASSLTHRLPSLTQPSSNLNWQRAIHYVIFELSKNKSHVLSWVPIFNKQARQLLNPDSENWRRLFLYTYPFRPKKSSSEDTCCFVVYTKTSGLWCL